MKCPILQSLFTRSLVLSCLAVLTVTSAACVHDRPVLHRFTGRIIRIDQPLRQNFAVKSGPTPLCVIYIGTSSHSNRPQVIRVRLTEVYAADIHGRVNDWVTVSKWSRSRFEDELSFGDATAYELSPKHHIELGSD